MIHFIVSDPNCERSNSVGIFPYKNLMFTRCHPKDAERVKVGLQGLSNNLVPIYTVSEWEDKVNKHFGGGK